MAAPRMISSPQDVIVWKQQARRQARLRRAACDPALGARMIDRLLQEMPPPPGAIVGGVWPLPGEIDLRPLLNILFERGHEVALPFTPPVGQPLEFRAWTPISQMVSGPFGTMHTEGAPLVPDYVLVPLLAFDRVGHRLGYGGGYYDRTLAQWDDVCAVGFGFAAQELPALCVEPTDRALDAIVTERELIKPEPKI